MSLKVTGLNHITLAVSDVSASTAFYRDVLGFLLRALSNDSAYLEAGALWLCLSKDYLVRTGPHPDYSHVALNVAEGEFTQLSERICKVAKIWKSNRSEGASLYFLDPDGHKLEIHVGDLASRLHHYRDSPDSGWAVTSE